MPNGAPDLPRGPAGSPPASPPASESERLRAPTLQGIPWRAQILSAGFMVADFLGVVLAYVAANGLYMSRLFEAMRLRSRHDPAEFLIFALIMAVLVILVFGAMGLYRRGVSVLNVEEDVLLLKGFIFHGLMALGLSFVLRDFYVPRIAVSGGIVLTAFFVVFGRRAVRGLTGWLFSAGVAMQDAVIYGAGDTGRQLAARLLANPQFGLRPVGFVDDRANEDGEDIRFGPGRKLSLRLLGAGGDCARILEKASVRVVLLAMPKISTERFQEIQERCTGSGVACYYVPLFPASHLRRFNLTFVGDIPLVSERAPGFGLLARTAKRAFDLAGSALLLLLLSPVFLLIVVVIRLSSRGPAVFRQERVGLGGRTFQMYKFRSMHADAPAYANKPRSGEDPRIFSFGRILRRTSFDEFPQLWNVLKGDMSLVGPRPEMPYIARDYNAVQRERFLVRPGMTGLWQVSGDRNLPIHESVDYDLYYIYNQTFLLDLVILARTALAMFGGR